MRTRACAFIVLLLLVPLAAAGPPTPESVFGFRPGADYKLATYDQSVDYFKKIAGSSKYVKLVDAGKTKQRRASLRARAKRSSTSMAAFIPPRSPDRSTRRSCSTIW